MITVDGLTVEFGGTTLFKDISFQINEKDRIALMGKNGAGKSTLLKIIAGVRNATRGTVSAPKDCVIAYLPQHLMTEDGRTVFEETCQAFAHLHEMQAEIDRINNELTTCAKPIPRLAQVVVLPTPPFWFAIAMTFATPYLLYFCVFWAAQGRLLLL